MDLLRFSTAGSVDDGKSTLIGRLLFDAKGIFTDQLEAVRRATRDGEAPDLALLTDGLRAEREQGITIDVAYRYFATPRRKFIIADTPGHEQYTRNMATGASTAEASVILVDARKGLQPQSRRHTVIADLLGIPHLLFVVNKMDLVDYDAARFAEIRKEIDTFLALLGRSAPPVIPVSALHGDNVVERSAAMPWYDGPAVLEHLESISVGDGIANGSAFRYPVQLVLRGDNDFRAYAGTVAAGTVRTGDKVSVLPSGRTTTVARIHTADGPLTSAHAGQSVALQLADELDVSRGDLLWMDIEPLAAREIEATLVWMGDKPLVPGRPYLVKHTTRCVRGRIVSVRHRLDIDTLSDQPATALALNEIGRVQLVTAQPLHLDAYAESRQTGAFILIDPESHATVAAGMVANAQPAAERSRHTAPERIDRRAREVLQQHRAGVVWLTGQPGAGKREIATALETRLFRRGIHAYVLDADRLRAGLSHDLGFTLAERSENLRRAAEVARLLADCGQLVIADFVTPTAAQKRTVREIVGTGDFIEIHVDAPDDAGTGRDPHGIYLRARTKEGGNDALIDIPYEPPTAPDLVLDVASIGVGGSVDRLATLLTERGWTGSGGTLH